MNIDEVRFNVYIDAIKRTRWFLLITTLLSCMLLIHMYLERFSFQEEQSIDTLRARVRDNKVNRLKEVSEQINADRLKAPTDSTKLKTDDFENLVDEYAQLTYHMTVFDNTLKEASIPERSLPLLTMIIPGNDFLSIIGFMILVFVIAVWLNVRSVLAAVISLEPGKNEEIRELIRLHFTFTGLVASSGLESMLAQAVQYSAFMLPCLSFLIALGLDIYSIVIALFEPLRGHAGPLNMYIWETLIMFVNLILLFIFTALTLGKIGKIGNKTKVRTTS